MKLLGCEQINLNLSNKFAKTYIQKQKKKKEAAISFHKLLENEQNNLEEQNMNEWTRMYSKVCGNNESREYANSLMENGKYEMKEAIRIAYDRFFSK